MLIHLRSFRATIATSRECRSAQNWKRYMGCPNQRGCSNVSSAEVGKAQQRAGDESGTQMEKRRRRPT